MWPRGISRGEIVHILQRPQAAPGNRGRLFYAGREFGEVGTSVAGEIDVSDFMRPRMPCLLAAMIFVMPPACEKHLKKPMTTEESDAADWDAAFNRIMNALSPYHDRVLAKYDSGQPLSEAEETVFHCLGYWYIAPVNSGDIFGNLHQVIGHENHFEAIGANGTLAAKDKLLPLYHEMMEKPSEKEQRDFSQQTLERRAEDEDLAEDCVEFGQLLLDYARKHDAEISSSPPKPNREKQ